MYWMISIVLCFVFPVVGALMLVAGLIFNVGVNLYDYWYTNYRIEPERRFAVDKT